jgi:hypothetical protein
MKTYEIKLTLTEEMLGTIAKDPEVYKGYIANKAALTDEELAEELATVENIEEKGWTGFHMLDGQPLILDYVIKGFFKDACGMLRRNPDNRSKKLTAYRKVIDGLVFVKPRRIMLDLNGKEMGVNERPLRASTAQGERIALARSDTVPAGTTFQFKVIVLGSVTTALLREWLNYGALRGLGQWRNAGFGTFTYELSEID